MKEEHISKIPPADLRQIRNRIEEKLIYSPLECGKWLGREWANYRRIRVGFYRIIYKVDVNKNIVTVVAIGKRENIYE